MTYLRALLPILLLLTASGCGRSEPPAATRGEEPTTSPTALTILTEDYPPLSYREDGKITGLATTIVRQLAAELGESPTFRLVPWDEGLDAVKQGPHTALFSTAMTEDRKDRLQWVGPIGILNTNFYALSEGAPGIDNLEDARRMETIATVEGYYSEEMLKEKGFANLVSHDSELAAMKSLLEGDTRLLVSSNVVVPTLLEKAEASPRAIKPLFTLSTDLTYLALSPDVAAERVDRWQRALDEMKRDGRFRNFYRQWLPDSDPPGVLQLVTEDYPPLTYRGNDEITGFVTDVVREIMERREVAEPIRLTSWENAYTMARMHPGVVLFSAERTPEREDLFHWVGPAGTNSAALYGPAGADLELTALHDAREVEAIATTGNWFTEQYLEEAGFTNLVSRPEPVDAVRMVMEGEADLTILTDSTAAEIVEAAGYTMADLQPLLTVMTTDYYIAFSRDTSRETVEQWRETLSDLKADGTLESIRRRYFPDQVQDSLDAE